MTLYETNQETVHSSTKKSACIFFVNYELGAPQKDRYIVACHWLCWDKVYKYPLWPQFPRVYPSIGTTQRHQFYRSEEFAIMGRKAAALSSSSQKLPSSSAAPNNNEQSIFGSVADILPFPITDNNNNNGLFAAAGSSSSSSSSSSVNKKKRSSAELNAGEDGEKVKRPPRVDYREPEAKARLQAAIDGVTMQVKLTINNICTVL